jgi:hypothetical protein
VHVLAEGERVGSGKMWWRDWGSRHGRLCFSAMIDADGEGKAARSVVHWYSNVSPALRCSNVKPWILPVQRAISR